MPRISRKGTCVECGRENLVLFRLICMGCRDIKRKTKPTPRKLRINRTKNFKEINPSRLRAIEKYGNKCICCGDSTPQFLHFDHVNTDGKEHRKILKQYKISMVKWLLDNEKDEAIQLLCGNCHNAKTHYGVCPHKLPTTYRIKPMKTETVFGALY